MTGPFPTASVHHPGRIRLLALLPALLAMIVIGCSGAPERDRNAEVIPASWEQPASADGSAPRVAIGPWYGWTLELFGGLDLVKTSTPDTEGTICSIYLAWLDGPDENPHASADRANQSIDNGRGYSIGYATLANQSTPLDLNLTRTTLMLSASGNVVPVQEGVFLKLNEYGDAGTFRHKVQVLPAVPHRRVVRRDDGPALSDWLIDDDARRPSRTVQWTTDAQMDLTRLDVQVPDPYAPNDPTRALRITTRKVVAADIAKLAAESREAGSR